MPTTLSPWRASRMPITPAASRPMARTSFSLKRAMRPCGVASTTSSSPDETPTHASSSSSATVIALMPVDRTRSNCSMGVFLITPPRVAMTMLWPFSKFGIVTIASTRSFGGSSWTPSRLMTGMPFDVRSAGAGMACTFELKTRPRLVKNSTQSCVPATSRCSTASSSTVRAPMMPLPPRIWRRYVASGWRLM